MTLMKYALSSFFHSLCSAADILSSSFSVGFILSSTAFGNFFSRKSLTGSAALIIYGVVKVVITDTAMMTG